MLLIGTLPCQDAFGKHDQTHSLITRLQDLQDAFDRHAPLSKSIHKNTTRRIRSQQDAKTDKTLSIGTLPCQDAFKKQNKPHSLITRRQDLQDAFDKHAPLSRRVHKNTTRPNLRLTRRQDLQDAFDRHAPSSRCVRKTRQDAFTFNKTPRPTRRFW